MFQIVCLRTESHAMSYCSRNNLILLKIERLFSTQRNVADVHVALALSLALSNYYLRFHAPKL